MKKKLQNFGILMLFFTASMQLKAQTNVIIDSSTPSNIFLYDGVEGNPFSDNNGIGWSGPWSITSGTSVASSVGSLVYPSGSGTAVYGGAINASGSCIIERSFTDTYELSETTFYLSFLVSKSATGYFTLKGLSGANPRYGVQVTISGLVRGRLGTSYGSYSSSGAFENDVTYLMVLAKQEGTIKVALFKEGDAIPTDPDNVTWVATQTGVTGVDLDKLEFELSSDNVKIDELRLGSTFASVTTGDAKNYNTPLGVSSFSSLIGSMYPNPASGKVFINTSKLTSENVNIQIIDLNGKLLLSKDEMTNQDNIELNISTLKQGVYIVKLSGEKENFSGKLVVD